MKKSSVKINIIYQMLYEVLVLCLPLFTSPYIARILGAENLGIYSYTNSIAVYVGMLCLLGVKNHGSREIAKSRGSQDSINKTFCSIYSLQLIVSVITFTVYMIIVLSCNSEYKVFLLIQSIYILSCLLDINWFFFGMEQFKLTVARNTIIKLFTFVSIFVFVKQPHDLWKYCLIISVGALASQIVVWIYLPKYVRFVKPEWADIKKNLKPMLTLIIPVLAVSFYNVMDKIMVGAMNTKTQAGYYENSEKIINCAKTVITSFGTVMMPRMSRLAEQKDLKQSNRYMMFSAEAVMCISFALAFGIGCIANIFAPIYWGDDFSACGVLLIGLSVSLPFSAMANFIRTQYIIPNNMDKTYITAVISGAVINLIVNALLIPSMGAMGAVIGTIFAEGIVCIIQCVQVRKKVAMRSYVKISAIFCIFGAIMAGVVIICQKHTGRGIGSLFILTITGAVIYIAFSILYFAVTKNEIFMGIVHKLTRKKHST